MESTRSTGFCIIPFAIDGNAVGRGSWSFSELSPRWVAICQRFLEIHGAVFESSWDHELSHIRTKFTSASGIALVDFSVRDHPSSSIILLRGDQPVAERQAATMFVDLLINTIGAVILAPGAFQTILNETERPLMAVVVYPDESILDLDRSLVQELSIHLAGAFFVNSFESIS